jgi:hypothetical protein
MAWIPSRSARKPSRSDRKSSASRLAEDHLRSSPAIEKVLLGLKTTSLPLPRQHLCHCVRSWVPRLQEARSAPSRAARAQCCSNRSLRAPAASACPVAESVLAHWPAPAPPAHVRYPLARRETCLSAPRCGRSGAHVPGFSLTCPRCCGCCYGLWQ